MIFQEKKKEMKTIIREGPCGERGEKGLWGGREEMAQRDACDFLKLD